MTVIRSIAGTRSDRYRVWGWGVSVQATQVNDVAHLQVKARVANVPRCARRVSQCLELIRQ